MRSLRLREDELRHTRFVTICLVAVDDAALSCFIERRCVCDCCVLRCVLVFALLCFGDILGQSSEAAVDLAVRDRARARLADVFKSLCFVCHDECGKNLRSCCFL